MNLSESRNKQKKSPKRPGSLYNASESEGNLGLNKKSYNRSIY